MVKDIAAQDLADIKRDLIQNHKVASLDFKQKDKREDDGAQIDEAKSILFKQEEMMEAWVKETGVPEGLDKDLLMSYGKEVTEALEEDEC